jgi:hypothetical protein
MSLSETLFFVTYMSVSTLQTRISSHHFLLLLLLLLQ